MLRVFCEAWDGGEEIPSLPKAEAHHLVRVRRVRPGEAFQVLNGRGAVATCRVTGVDASGPQWQLESRQTCRPLPVEIHLLVALPKGKTFPLLLQKMTELGVARITPLLSEHAEVSPERAGHKQDRWQAVLVEAVKQSGNPWMPLLGEPLSLPDALASPPAGRRVCAALQPGAHPFWGFLENKNEATRAVEVFVGPEGDFSPDEYARLRQGGCRFVSLGPIVLKVETAASLVCGMIAQEAYSRE